MLDDHATTGASGFPAGVSRLLVLGKIRRVLDAFSPQRPVLTLNQLRSTTGLPASTCFRLVQNLVHEGVLERTGDQYRLGLTIIRWGASAIEARSIVASASPILEGLREATGESAHLVVRDGAFRICVALANSHHSVVRRLHIGEVVPIHVGSTGRVFLAFDPDAKAAIAGQELQPITSNTLIDWKALDEAIDHVRHTGYAVSFEELDPGAVGITAPVFDHGCQMVAALGISGPTQRMDPERVDAHAPLVVAAARTVSKLLGCPEYA